MKFKKNDRVLSTNDKTLISALKAAGYEEVKSKTADNKINDKAESKTGG